MKELVQVNGIPTLYVDYTDTIPLMVSWPDDYSGTPVAITLVGTVGAPLNNPDNQLCYFSLIDEATGDPVTVDTTTYEYVDMLLDTTVTQAVYPIQDWIPAGSYTVISQYDSTNTTNVNIKPLRKKAIGRVIVKANSTGDIDPQS